MNRRGFTLIEVLVVIGLMGILIALGTFGFSSYTKKSQMANQTKVLYGSLMEYRAKALFEKREWTFLFTANSYAIYPSSDTSGTPVETITLKYPISMGGITFPEKITFDGQGLVNVSRTACIASDNESPVDAVVIAKTRTELGKRQQGANCESEHVNAQ